MKEVAATGTLKAGDKALAELKKRKLIVQKYVLVATKNIADRMSLASRKSLWYSVEKGTAFSTTIEKLETDLTAEMITS